MCEYMAIFDQDKAIFVNVVAQNTSLLSANTGNLILQILRLILQNSSYFGVNT